MQVVKKLFTFNSHNKCNGFTMLLLFLAVYILHLLPFCHCLYSLTIFYSRLHTYCLYSPAPSRESNQILLSVNSVIKKNHLDLFFVHCHKVNMGRQEFLVLISWTILINEMNQAQIRVVLDSEEGCCDFFLPVSSVDVNGVFPLFLCLFVPLLIWFLYVSASFHYPILCIVLSVSPLPAIPPALIFILCLVSLVLPYIAVC